MNILTIAMLFKKELPKKADIFTKTKKTKLFRTHYKPFNALLLPAPHTNTPSVTEAETAERIK